MITCNVTTRTLYLKFRNATGTCFVMDHEEKQYLVTAKHVLNGISSQDVVEVCRDRTWVPLAVKTVGLGDGRTDIAALAPPFQLVPKKLPVVASMDGLVYGQDVYFLGFPYGLFADLGKLNNDLPFPFVKKAIVSSLGGPADKGAFYLDGHNNPGFSGGPVVFVRPGKIPPTTPGEILKLDYQFAGVISAYRCQAEPVYDSNRIPSGLVNTNTGIIVCYSVGLVLEMIKANPIGFRVTE